MRLSCITEQSSESESKIAVFGNSYQSFTISIGSVPYFASFSAPKLGTVCFVRMLSIQFICIAFVYPWLGLSTSS